MSPQPKAEIIDLVDINDQVIGQIERDNSINNKEVHGGYIRVIDCFIVSSQGELWVPKRTADKEIAPSGLDFSVGEHVQAGEDYMDAVVRGFKEELGFEPNPELLHFLGKRKPVNGSDIFQAVFKYESDDAPDFNPKDFVSASWISPDNLLAMILRGVAAKPNIAPTVEGFFL